MQLRDNPEANRSWMNASGIKSCLQEMTTADNSRSEACFPSLSELFFSGERFAVCLCGLRQLEEGLRG